MNTQPQVEGIQTEDQTPEDKGWHAPRIKRRETTTATVGAMKIGSDHPIAVQTMLNAPTTDVEACIQQTQRCIDAGAEIVRISVPDTDSAVGFAKIMKELDAREIGVKQLGFRVPIIADIHFHYKLGIDACKAGADCTRINPGNIGTKERAREVVQASKDANCSIRIGVNVGSLEPALLDKYGEPCAEALVESALNSVKTLEDMDFFNLKISVKASDVLTMKKAYELLAEQCSYPLHLGVTEAGPKFAGSIKSAVGIGSLLANGIGDTIRVSLSTAPEDEPSVALEILKSLSIKRSGAEIVSCPSCARQQFDVIKTVQQVEEALASRLKPLKISILGCVVNGIGEAKESDIGITGAGSGKHLIYLRGKPHSKAESASLLPVITELVAKEFPEE